MTGPIVLDPDQGQALQARGSGLPGGVLRPGGRGRVHPRDRDRPPRTGNLRARPGGVAHTFDNAGSAPARTLVLHAPAMDGYFRKLQALWAGPTPSDRDAELDLMRRHGMTPA